MGSRRRRPVPDDITPSAANPADDRRWAPGEWWEWLAIFFAIAALWPRILRWDHIIWDVLLWSALALMFVVMRRRLRRVRRSGKGD